MIPDTNPLLALVDGNPRIEGVLRQATDVRLNVISLGEYRFGLLRSRHRTEYETRLARLELDIETLGIDPATAILYALLRYELKSQGKPIPYRDIWISALARQHELPVLSRDTHFDAPRGIQRLPW